MAIIHKLIESGAEEYLPFLLARERVIRRQRSDNADGSMSGGYAVKYDFGDVSAELRMVGNQSYVRLSRTGASRVGRVWVAFTFEPNFQFSDTNNIPVFNGPQGSERPVFTVPQPVLPDRPLVPDFDIGVYITPPPESAEFPVSTFIDDDQRNARTAVIEDLWEQYSISLVERSYAPFWLPNHRDQLNLINTTGDGLSALGYRLVLTTATDAEGNSSQYWKPVYDVAMDPAGPMLEAMARYRATIAAWNASGNALSQAWQAELATWNRTVLAAWEAQNFPNRVCPPYYRDVLPAQRASRASQVATLYAELRKGMGSIGIASRVLRPQYVPKEEPAEPIATETSEWVSVGTYVQRSEVITTSFLAPIFPTCGDEVRADQHQGTYPYSPPINGNNTPSVSLDQGFGYMVSGTTYDRDRAAPSATVRLMTQYQDWLESPRRPGQNWVSFDLVYGDTPGEICIALFEFYAYDYKTDQWMWTPSVGMLDLDPLLSCYSICFGYPDSERDSTYTNRPVFGSVTQMRSYAFLKHTKTPKGWGPAVPVNASQITLDVTAFNRNSFPSAWCAVKGAQEWMAPATPGMFTAVDKAFMAASTATIPASTATEAVEWLHAQCLTRFQIPFK